MKKLMTALLVSLTASSVMAAGADMTTVRYVCKQAKPSKNLKMTVLMLQGGIAGVQISVTKTVAKKETIENYIVKPGIAGPIGGPTIYRGQNGMSFSVNNTSSPTHPRKATLVEEDGTVTQLLCELNKSKS